MGFDITVNRASCQSIKSWRITCQTKKHFPGDSNMPGCLQIEAMAQMLTVAITTVDGMEGKVVHGYKHAGTFHREVRPGDRLEMDAEILSFRRGLCRGKVTRYVDGEIACELETTIIIPDVFNQFKPQSEKKTA